MGAVVNKELVVRLLLEELRDSVGVIRAKLKTPQDEYFEGTLQEFEPLR